MRSHDIKRKTTQTILHAFDYAKYIDRPLNLHVIIRMTGIELEDGHDTFSRIRHKCYRWLQRKQRQSQGHHEAPYYVYVFENPDDADLHLHWVLHVPPSFHAEFRKKLGQWVTKVFGWEPSACAVHVEDVDPYEDKSLAKYILKGTEVLFRGHFNLAAYATGDDSQGLVVGRRAYAAQALNREARKAAGFVAKDDRNKWRDRDWAKAYPAPAHPYRRRSLPYAAQRASAASAAAGSALIRNTV